MDYPGSRSFSECPRDPQRSALVAVVGYHAAPHRPHPPILEKAGVPPPPSPDTNICAHHDLGIQS